MESTRDPFCALSITCCKANTQNAKNVVFQVRLSPFRPGISQVTTLSSCTSEPLDLHINRYFPVSWFKQMGRVIT